MNFYFHCISNKDVQKRISASRSVFIMFSCKLSIRLAALVYEPIRHTD